MSSTNSSSDEFLGSFNETFRVRMVEGAIELSSNSSYEEVMSLVSKDLAGEAVSSNTENADVKEVEWEVKGKKVLSLRTGYK